MRALKIILTEIDNADLGMICITILGIAVAVLCYVKGLELQSALTGAITAVAAIARTDKDKGGKDEKAE